ncbi:TonB-dependent receptor [Sphingomonas piscis]|uniref:TonB-dependent receptor n=1 Tax=Sphingomonas piscis TaxID=2714943 RepID=A0A6G7YLJ1_9SPHN|nr:TonB-dependent receptor [Sphingomonas piscis]QIK77576.1 TonB-dependent receptor [Sphingomonas piscis]
MQALPVQTADIVITSSRVPEAQADSPASVTVVDGTRIERLGEPLLPVLLRQAPSVSVASSGPAGSLTEVRIRGAEANHTLLFIEGIRANDPAAGNIPRFELLNGDLFSRLEVVRGPQSALWGSEAIGGVVAVDSAANRDQLSPLAEAGSFRFRRAAVQASQASQDLNLSAAIGWQRARGIDSFDGNGDRDGYRNLSGRARAAWSPTDAIQLGASGFALSGRSEFDGYSPVTFLHADTLDSTRNKLAAGRLWTELGSKDAATRGLFSASLLRSSNRNLLAGDEINRTRGKRATLSGQVEHRLSTGGVQHLLIGAAELEKEDFSARDLVYGGASNQDRDRKHQAVTGEWRADAGAVTADVAVRRDFFSRFDDATTLRASLLGKLGGGFSLAASYGEGIAQPSFFDLYGFFPGSFVGNPGLKPESSRGAELSLRYQRGALRGGLTVYRQRLSNEILDTFDSTTFLSSTANSDEKSRRQGVEAEVGYSFGDVVRLTATYAYLKATQPDTAAGFQVREVRRPRHSGSVALDGNRGAFSYGAAIAYTGERSDTDFDSFPARSVRLQPYWLADARLAYRVGGKVELFTRFANAFGDRHQDVFGYRTEGRSVHVGLRFASRR